MSAAHETLATVEIQSGNAMPLKMLPIGSFIHNLEFQPGQGGKLMRAAGTFAKLLSKEFPKPERLRLGRVTSPGQEEMRSISIIRLKSGRLYSLSNEAMGTLGIVSSTSSEGGGVPAVRKLRKAGENR